MSDVQHWIDRCRRRLNRGLVLKVTAEWLAVWLCAFGTLLLVTKVAWPALWPHVLWLGLSVVPVVGLAIRRALREAYTADEGAAFLDRRLKAGGLLMAVAEKPDGQWRQQLPREEAVWTLALPRVRPVRFARVVVLPLVFAVVALLLPARAVPTNAATARRPLAAVQELPEMLAELKKADVLDPGEAAFLQEEIDKLTAATSKAPPTPDTWRKIDALRARLNDRLDRETRTIEKGRQAARKLAQAGKNGLPPLSNEQRRQLERDLAEALKRTRDARGAAKRQATQATVSKTDGKTASPPVATAGKSPAQGVNSKTPAGKSAFGAKQPKQSSEIAKSTEPATKKPVAGTLKKTVAKSGNQKSPSGAKLPKFDPSMLRDLAKVAKMVENLSPEMREKLRQEVMKMIQSGQIRIPSDPAVRDMLMREAQRMLAQDGQRLEELRKRFGHLAGNLDQWKKLQPPDRPDSANGTGNGGMGSKQVAGKQPVNATKQRTGGSASFRDIVLPPGLLDKPRDDPDSVSGKRPSVSPFQPTVPVAAKTAADPAGEKWRALRRKVRPRNRNLVYRYFYGQDGK